RGISAIIIALGIIVALGKIARLGAFDGLGLVRVSKTFSNMSCDSSFFYRQPIGSYPFWRRQSSAYRCCPASKPLDPKSPCKRPAVAPPAAPAAAPSPGPPEIAPATAPAAAPTTAPPAVWP